MENRKSVALVAHDNMKRDLAEWVDWNWEVLLKHHLICTGTPGKMVERTLRDRRGKEFDEEAVDIVLLKSGPLGGDQQMGSLIADGKIDFLIFFWDPLSAHPHDPDVKALLRIAVLYDIPVANNQASADFMLSSPMMNEEYDHNVLDFSARIKDRAIDLVKEGN